MSLSYYVVFKPEGRLGNALFRYVASSIICQKFNMKYILLEDFVNDDNIMDKQNMVTITDHNYIDLLDYGRLYNYNANKHILMSGYYQFDFVFTHFKQDVLDFIYKTKGDNHEIQVDMNDGYKRYRINDLFDGDENLNLNNNETNKKYDTIIHLRLGDIFRSNQFDYISPEYLEKVYENEEKSSAFANKRIALVVENKTNPDEVEVINRHVSWFKTRDLKISVESNDVITDFKLFTHCETLICSHSTLSWMAAYFSNSIKKCYMPNYNFLNERTYCYFRNPIENTILYDVFSTKFNDLKVFIITLEKYPERRKKLLNLISSLCKIGLKVEFFNGVDGNDVLVRNTKCEFINILEYKHQIYAYDKRIRLNGAPMKKGEIGCSMSHVLLYKKLKEDECYNKYLILEDDADLDVRLEDLYKTISNMPANFDVLHLSKSDWYPFEKEERINDIFYRPKKMFFNRSTGYIISKQGSEKLLDAIQGNMISLPADDLLSNTYITTDNFDLYYSERFIFRERDDALSTIDKINKMTD